MKTVSRDIILFLAFGDCHLENQAPCARSRYGEVRLPVVQKCTGTHSARANSLSRIGPRCWIGTIFASSWRSPAPAACQPLRGDCAAPKQRSVVGLLPLRPASV